MDWTLKLIYSTITLRSFKFCDVFMLRVVMWSGTLCTFVLWPCTVCGVSSGGLTQHCQLWLPNSPSFLMMEQNGSKIWRKEMRFFVGGGGGGVMNLHLLLRTARNDLVCYFLCEKVQYRQHNKSIWIKVDKSWANISHHQYIIIWWLWQFYCLNVPCRFCCEHDVRHKLIIIGTY